MRTIIAAAIVLLFSSLALAGEETRYYDVRGGYQGRATTDPAIPNQQILRGQHGEYLGHTAQTPSGDVIVRDQHGNYMGRATRWQENQKKNY